MTGDDAEDSDGDPPPDDAEDSGGDTPRDDADVTPAPGIRDTDEGESTADDAPFRGAGLDEETAEEVLADALEDPVSTPVDEDPFDGDGDSTDGRWGLSGFGGPDGFGGGPGRGPDAAGESADRGTEPEAALESQAGDSRGARRADAAELRDAYGVVRAYFKTRPERYQSLRRRLKQARIGVTYDEYLETSVRVAAVTALAGVLVGVGLALAWPTLAGLTAAADAPAVASLPTAVVALAGVAGGILGAVTGWVGRNYYYPRRVIARRRRNIALTLPYAITYMYALSSGGMNFLAVCRQLAAADAVYGEVANEFDVVVREVDLFGNDLPSALGNVRSLTPSDGLQRFLDDLLSVLESGGDLEAFLESESREYLDDAIEEQTSFIETLGTLSEVFVVAFVATPLFLLVVMLVLSSLGSSTLREVALLVYVVFPLAMVLFVLLVDLLSAPYEQPAIASRGDEGVETLPDAATDERYEPYTRASRRQRLRSLLTRPLATMRRRPVTSLALSVPIAVAALAVAVAAGVADPSVGAFVERPVATTTGLAVAPLLVATVPLAALHERKRRRALVLTERFPDVLGILASANRMGIDVVDGFDLVVRWTSGTLAAELRTVRNDVAWNHDLPAALLAFADRIRVPELTRTVRLVADGSETTGDLHNLLEVAATDTRARAKIRRARRRAVGSYVAIVVLGFLVYLLVVVLLSGSYLDPLGELPELPDVGVTSGVPIGGVVPVDEFRLLFFHSALVQGFGSGLLAGKLAENDLRSGLKYGIGLVLLTLAVFAFFV